MLKRILYYLLSTVIAVAVVGTTFIYEIKRDFNKLVYERLDEVNYETLRVATEEYVVFDEVKEHYNNKPLKQYIADKCEIDKTVFAYLNKQDKSSNLYAQCIIDIDNQINLIIMEECDYMLSIKEKYKENVINKTKEE